MRKNIARKFALLLALTLLVTTFGSDYNSIGVRADEGAPEQAEDVDYSPVFSEPIGAEQETPAEEEIQEEPEEEQEEPEEEAPAEEPQPEQQEEEQPAQEEEAQPEETPAAETPADETPAEETPADETPAAETPADETPAEAPAEDAPAAETPADETPAAETPADETPATAVTIRFVAGEGGTVSKEAETVDMSIEGAAFEGALATANEGFEFVNWTNVEGTPVCETAAFAPVGDQIINEAVYTANFKAAEVVKEEKVEEPEEEMPAKDFEDVTDNNVTVKVSAPEGAFPVGTTMSVSDVTNPEIIDAVKDAANSDVENSKQEAVAVDITFRNEKGEEIEPKCAISVAIYSPIIEKENSTLVHVDDEQKAEVVDASFKEDKAEFTSDEFSIYAIVVDPKPEVQTPRRTYKFQDSDGTPYMFTNEEGEEVDNQIIKNGEALAEIPAPYSTGMEFIGWYEYDTEGGAYTENKITFGAAIDLSALTKDEEVIVRAKYKNSYIITYLSEPKGENNERAILETVEVLTEDGSCKIDYNYEASDPETSAFLGWKLENPAQQSSVTIDGTWPDYIANGTEVKIKDNITLIPYVPTGHWLIFHENGKGASYTPSAFVEGGVLNDENRDSYIPADPKRKGYDFAGWYTCKVNPKDHKPYVDDNGNPVDENNNPYGEEYSFLGTLDKNVDLLAMWTPAGTAPYTVIIWKQNLKGDDYDYAESITVQDAPTGVVASGIVLHTADCYATINGKNYGGPEPANLRTAINNNDPMVKYVGFKPVRYDSTKKISPDGNTIINVYFDRIEYVFQYRLAFYRGNSLHAYTDGSRTQSRELTNLPADAFAAISERVGNNYVVTRTAKYGQDITGLWPKYEEFASLKGKLGRLRNADAELVSWILDPNAQAYTGGDNQGGETVKGKLTVMDEQLLGNWKDPNANYVDARYDGNPYNYSYYICVEKENSTGTTARNTATTNAAYEAAETIVHNRVEYTLKEIVPSKANSDYGGQKAPAYEGFTAQKDANGRFVYEQLTENGQSRGMAFYYTRNTSGITYMDGAYYTGNGVKVEGMVPDTILKEVEDIKFATDLTSYNKNVNGQQGANYYVPTPKYEGIIFDGWYKDAECQDPYTFTTMTKDQIIVYAKWILKQYRVILHPNAYEDDGTTKKAGYFIGNQGMSFRVDYNDLVSPTSPTADDYEFVGWYRDTEFSELFSCAATALNDTSVITPYDRTGPTEYDQLGNATSDINGDEHPKDNDGNPLPPRFWITRRLDLYAKWRSKLAGANGINVEYVDNDGNVLENLDTKLYSDHSAAIAKDCPDSIKKITVNDEEKVFDHWVVQKYENSAYTNSDTTVTEGKSFTVYKRYAKVTANSDNTPENPSYTYTVRLIPAYKSAKNDNIKLTHINYHGNEGTTSLTTDASKNLTVSDDKATASYEKLQLNTAIILSDEGFTREHYTLVGWEDRANQNTVYKVGDKIGVDQNNPLPNDLYAVWEINKASYIIRYYKDEVVEGGTPLASVEKGPVDVGTRVVIEAGEAEGQLDYKKPDSGYESGVQQGLTEEKPYYEVQDTTKEQYIDVLYVASSTSYTIEYYKGDANGNPVGDPIGTETVDNVTVGSSVGQLDDATINAKRPGGYKNGVQKNTIETIVAEASNNVIKVVYSPIKVTVTVRGKQCETDYDGTEKSQADSNLKDKTAPNANWADGWIIESVEAETGYEVSESDFTISTVDLGLKYPLVKTDAGTYENEFTENNFVATPVAGKEGLDIDIEVEDGYLKINKITSKVIVKIKGEQVETYYTGNKQSTDEFETAGFNGNGYAVVSKLTEDNKPVAGLADTDIVLAEGKTAEAHGTESSDDPYPMNLTKDHFQCSNENFTDVEFEIVEGDDGKTKDGYILIKPVEGIVVTLHGEILETLYSGEEQSTADEQFEGLDKFTVDSIKKDGEDCNLIDASQIILKDGEGIATGTDVQDDPYAMGLTEDSFECSNKNYKVSYIITSDGGLKINPVELVVRVTGHNNGEGDPWTGKEISVKGFDIGLDEEFAQSTNTPDAVSKYDIDKSVEFDGTKIGELEKEDGAIAVPVLTKKNVGTYPMGLDQMDERENYTRFVNTDTNYRVFFMVEDGYLKINPPAGLYTLTAETIGGEEQFSGKTWTGPDFDYKISGEAPKEVLRPMVEALNSFIGGLTSFFGLKAHATTEEDLHSFEIDGVTFYAKGLRVEVTARDVDTYELDLVGTPVIMDGTGADATDVTEFFDVEHMTIIKGKFKITPKPITITSGSAEKVYDGQPLRMESATNSPELAEGDAFTYTFTKSQTEVGECDNEFDFAPANEQTKVGNYQITKVYGKLKVTATTDTNNDDDDDDDDDDDNRRERRRNNNNAADNDDDDDNDTQVLGAKRPADEPAAVLGAKREQEEPGVLGARRGGTDDNTNASRVIVLLIAAGAVATILVTGRKRKEDEE
ncbi:InlB B-repeat-containing protein [Butyrivibrio sp. AE3006]|uniref:InlB B-repeat-containing protein n=1 Tax=Butyrivibrio sp. AE3006 TaxID=1280673 RepID=UPI00041B8D57|nr:InlB B-repeat-containing protein [Butyrivibrio sp. AE3006]